jgi:hypothetical protein
VLNSFFRKLSILFFLLGIVIFITSCRKFTDEKYISEGIIEYKIEYPYAEENSLLVGLLPDKLQIKFKDDKVALDMTGGMGMFRIILISNPETETATQLVKLLNKKFALELSKDEVDKLFKNQFEIKNIEFIKGEDTVIASYNCKKAIVHCSIPNRSYTIYYTNEFDINNPNWATPYKEINGIMMDYPIKMYNIEMHLTNPVVIKEEVDDSLFILPKDYKIISKEEMDNLLLNIN